MQSVKMRVFTATIISYYTRLCKKKRLAKQSQCARLMRE